MISWDERYKSGEGVRWWPNEELVRFLGHIYPFGSIALGEALDLGCGTGCNMWLLAETGFDAYGMDASLEALKRAKNFMSDHWIEPSPATFTHGQLPVIPFESGRFDLVVDCQTIQHLSNDDHEKAYREVVRVLRSGGRFWHMHWAGYDEHRALIYGGQYPELHWRNEYELHDHLCDAGFTEVAIPYRVTREYRHLGEDVLAQWLVCEVRKP